MAESPFTRSPAGEGAAGYQTFVANLQALRRAVQAGPKQPQLETAVLALLRDWAGSEAAARAWYAGRIIPGFGATAEALVRSGRAEGLLLHLRRVADGGYA